MRLIKMFGFAMLAAVAAMAFVGVGSASAQHKLLGSILCQPGKWDGSLCPNTAGNEKLEFLGELTALGTSLFVSSVGTHVECHTEMKGKIENSGGLETHPSGKITHVLFTNCKGPCEGTEAGAEALPWSASVTGSGTLNNGTMHVTNAKGWFRSCGVKCTYWAETSLAAVSPGLIVATEIKLNRLAGLEFLCGNSGKWSADLSVTPANILVHLL